MCGAPDPAYVRARRALLDGLEALQPHLESLVVVGAQAVYMHTGDADLAVAELTTDADLVIGPEFLASRPAIQDLMESGGFELQSDPGLWRTPDGIQVDLMVPEGLALYRARHSSAGSPLRFVPGSAPRERLAERGLPPDSSCGPDGSWQAWAPM